VSNPPHILVIDDEPQILRALRTILTEKQFKVTTASRGEEGLSLAAANVPDVVILDLGLPDMDGIEVCARLREWTQCPIIVLSVREGEKDKVAALDKGADDYLTKPFGIQELLARVRVALRHASRAQGAQEATVQAGPLSIDLAWHVVTRGGQAHRHRIQAAGLSGRQSRPRPHPSQHSHPGLGAGGCRSYRVCTGLHPAAAAQVGSRP